MFAAVLGIAMAGAGHASSPTFRPLLPPPPLPVESADPNEMRLIQADRDQLVDRARALSLARERYDQECGLNALNLPARRDCQFRLVDLRRETVAYNADVAALEQRFARIAEELSSRRLSGGGLDAGRDRRQTAERRMEILRDALGKDGWDRSLDYIHGLRDTRAGDAALRDVATYLEGMRSGTIVAANLTNPFYRYGVWRHLAGDDWSAALAFARAAQDEPDDARVFASFASAAARQHRSPACVRRNHCVGGDVVAFAAAFGEGQADAARDLLSAIADDAAAKGPGAAVNRLRGAAIYAAGLATDRALNPIARGHATEAAHNVRAGKFELAARQWADAWLSAEPARAGEFFRIYDGGDPALADRKDFDRLRRALSAGTAADPFSVSLGHAEIIRLQR